MKKIRFSLATLGFFTLMSCAQSPAEQKAADERHSIAFRNQQIDKTLSMQDEFQNKNRLSSKNSGWYCPDNVRGFPPVDKILWDKVPVVNNRLPTYEETQNGTALMYYDINETPHAKPYNMTLPKLASFFCPYTNQEETVIVIQITQTAKDTVAGYRFLSGGNGTSDFRDLHFLTDNEIKKVIENTH